MKKSSLIATLVLLSVIVYAEVVTQFNGTPIGVTTGIGLTNNSSGVYSNNIVAGNNITLTEGANGQLTVGSSWGSYEPSLVILRDKTQTILTNSTTETAIFTNTIPAGILGTTKNLKVQLRGRYFNNNAAATMVVRVYLGSTKIYDDTTASAGANSAFAPIVLNMDLSAINSASVQRMVGFMEVGPRGSVTTGIGDFGNSSSIGFKSFGGSATENSANALGLGVTIQNSLSGAVSWITDWVSFTLE